MVIQVPAVVQVPTYGNEKQTLRANPRVMQQAPSDDGSAQVGQALVGLGQQVGRAAEVQDQRLAALDEAEVLELDADFAKWERDSLYGENGVLRQTGRNALNARDPFVEQYGQRRQETLGRAQGERQRAMLTRALDAREARALTSVDTHTATEVETYRTATFNAHVSQAGLDLAAMSDDESRIPQFRALVGSIRAEGDRLGWSPEMTDAALLETTTNIHTGWVERVLSSGGNPHEVEAYLDQWQNQISGPKLTDLREATLKTIYEFDSSNAIAGMPDLSPATTTTVPTPTGGPLTLHPPVAAGSLSSPFGQRAAGNHRGVDLAVPVNTPVTASAAGTIRWRNDPDGYGRYAVIDHGNGVETRYAHMSGARVEDGQQVEAGQLIGLSGGARGSEGAGNSRGPHVHYEVRRNGIAVDPQQELSGEAPAATETHASQPATLEDAYTWADREAERQRPGDWRYRNVMREAAVTRYGQTRSIAADQERQAADALAPYFSGGAQEGQTPPANILSAASPQLVLSYRRDREAAVNGEAQINPEQAYSTYNSLVDLARTSPRQFAGLNVDGYAGVISLSQRGQLREMQRDIIAPSGGRNTEVTSLLSGVAGVVDAYLEETGVKIDTVEGQERKAQLTQWVLDAASAQQTPPDRNGLIGLVRLGVRQVQGQSGERRAYQGAANATEVISSAERRTATASLRREYPGVTSFTEQQIAARHRRLVFQGN